MRIINKMKKTMLVLAASLFCANIAFADTQTVYSWESPEGTPAETGGTMVYTNGDGERLNYSNAGYHTICLNGKPGNIGDTEASANAGHMVLTLDEALKTGDVISITAYRNKNAEGKAASIYFLFENGAVWKDTNTFVNICADDADEDYDDDGATPNTVTWTITDAEAGSKTLKLTRNSSGTNLFITKMTITREVEDAPAGGEAETTTYDFKNWPDNTVELAISDEVGTAWETGNGRYQKIYQCTTVGLENFAFQAVYPDGGNASKGTWLRHEKGLMNFGATRSMAILGLKAGDVVTITSGVVDFTGGGTGDGTWTVETIEGGYTVTMTADGNLGMCIAKNDYIYSIAITSAAVAEPEPTTEKAYATFEAPTNTNAIWNAETKSFTWTQSYYNQIRNIGLPTGDITKYAKLVIDCEIISGTQFRILFYKGGDNLPLFVTKSGVTEFVLADTLKSVNANYMDYLKECTEICLSGAGDAGEVKINSMYLETAPATGGEGDTELVAAVDSLKSLIAEAEAWKAELNPEDEMHAQVIPMLEQMIPAAQAVVDEPASLEAVNNMIFDVYAALGTYKPMVEQYDAKVAASAALEAAKALLATYTEYTDEAGFAAAIAAVENALVDINMGMVTLPELNAAVEAMKAAQEAFVTENTPAEEPEQPAEPIGEVIFSANFDGEGAQPLGGWGNEGLKPTFAVVDGVMKVSNPVAGADWHAQMAQDFTTKLELGQTYTLKFKVKGSVEGSISANLRVSSTYAGAGNFGKFSFTTEWQEIELTTVCTSADANSLIFNFGDFAGDIFMDDIVLSFDAPLAPKNWVSVITNGDFEGEGATSFVTKENGGANAGAFLAPAITDAIGKDGSRGIKVKSYAGATNDYDAQFWIAPSKALTAGVEYRVAFDYRATAAVTVGTQAHDAPGAYKHNDAIGSVSFTTEWQHVEKTGIVTADYASVAFNLSVDKANDVEFFFDNVTFEVVQTAPAFDMTSLEKAVADAEAWKATLKADDEVEAMAIEAVDEYVKSAQEWAAEAETQEDVEMAAEDLAMTIEALKGQLEVQKMMAKVEEARIAGEEALNAYPENLRSDRAGLVIALRNLPRFAMGMTAEMIQAAIDAVYTAIPLYKAENEPITAGTFYMKNVAAGKYLAGGNSWGTQASLSDHGLDVIVTRLENGKYTIDTNVPNGKKHFLGSNGYVDSEVAEWTLTKVTGGNYVISIDNTNFIGYDSTTVVSLTLTDTTTTAAQWQFITKDELLREFANATVDSPVDATFFIQGQGFNRNDANRNAAWQGGPGLGGGDHSNWCAEKWNANFDIYQDLTGLPNGSYRLTAQGFYRAGNGGTTETAQLAMLYAGSKSVPLVNILSEAGNAAISGNTSDVPGYGLVPNNMETAGNAFTAGLYAGHSIDVLVTDGTLRIGVKKDSLINSDWTIFDNFELAYLGTELYDAVAPLIEIVGEAKAWQATLNAEDAMQAQIIATIDQMIPAAQAVIDNPEPLAAVNEMYNSVYMFLFQTKISLAQYEAQMAQALMATYTEPTDAAGFEAAINQVFIVSNDLMMNAGNGEYTMDDLAPAVAAMKAAQEAFIIENTPVYKTASVALAANMFKTWDSIGADAQPTGDATPEIGVGNELGGGAMVYGFSTVDPLAYADLTGYEKIVFEGTPGMVIRVLMNRELGGEPGSFNGALVEVKPVIGEDGKAEVDLTGYDYVHVNAMKTDWGGAAGTITAINLVYTPSIAYLCGATETTEAIYTALVNAGYNVTALNYDNVTLTEEIVASDFVGKYNAVVLAGGTGSGTNLAKTANLLLGKVNVLSTKAFWYKHYGTNGDNPGTAETPSLGLVKTVAEHPIFAGIEGAEFAVFNDMGKENGRYLQSNGQFADNTPAQKALATTNGADCIGEAWVDGKGYVIIPVDGAQPEGYLTAAGEALFVNAIDYLLAGTEYVEPTVDVTSITLDQTAVELLEGATVTLVATVAPENATDKTITWTTSNEAVATVADGVVTAVAAGEAVITAQAGNVTATCTITIKADGIEVIGIESTLTGDIYDLSGRLVKKNATSTEGLQKGIYLINGKKVAVK